MIESGVIDTPTSLDALRSEGAQRLDPMRFHYMEVLSQRLQTVPDEVRRLLEGKLNDALSDYAQRFKQARQVASDEVARLSKQRPELTRELRRLFDAGDFRGVRQLGVPAALKAPCTPLAELNQHIRAISQGATQKPQNAADGPGGMPSVGLNSLADRLGSAPPDPSEMKSLRRFRETWSKIAAENQVDKAIGRRPQNAGPLNSHLLVLRSLTLMRDLSPDYLRRFLSHLDSLLWLDQASQQSTVTEPKPTRRAKTQRI